MSNQDQKSRGNCSPVAKEPSGLGWAGLGSELEPRRTDAREESPGCAQRAEVERVG